MLLGGAGAADLFRNDSLQEQVRALEVLPSRTPEQEQRLELLRRTLTHPSFALQEVLSRIGVRFHSGGLHCPSDGGRCTLRDLRLSGAVPVTEVEAALRQAGYVVLGTTAVLGPPEIAPAAALPPSLPLHVAPTLRYVQFAGQPLYLQVTLNNPSAQPLNLSWGMNVLSAVLLNDEEEVVTWDHPYSYGLAGIGASCPAHQPCTGSLRLSLPLTHYGTGDSLPSGRYHLRVRINGLRVGDAPPLTFTLPDLPITVEAPNAR